MATTTTTTTAQPTAVYVPPAGQSAPTNRTMPPNMSVAPVTTTPTTSSNVVSTSSTARNQVASANQYLNNQNALATQKTQNVLASNVKGSASSGNQQASNVAKTVSSIAADLSDKKLKSSALEGLSGAEAAQKAYLANVKKITKQLESLQANMDARTAATIENIKAEYDQIMEEQRQSNMAYERGVYTSGLVQGRAQYAPEIQAGLTAQAVNYGIKKLNEIQTKRAQLINEAEAARDERNYRLLTSKMELIRQTYLDERDTAFKMQDELRKAAQYEMELSEYQGTNLAPYVSSLLTGNEEEDSMTIQSIAEQSGVSPTVLYKYLDDYRRDQIKDAPASIQEYLYLKDNGMLPGGINSYSSYVSYKASSSGSGSSGGKTISQQFANDLGAPALAGFKIDDVITNSTNSRGQFVSTPPEWFKNMIRQQGLGMSEQIKEAIVVKAWEDFKSNPAAQQLRTGRRPSDSDPLAGLNLDDL